MAQLHVYSFGAAQYHRPAKRGRTHVSTDLHLLVHQGYACGKSPAGPSQWRSPASHFEIVQENDPPGRCFLSFGSGLRVSLLKVDQELSGGIGSPGSNISSLTLPSSDSQTSGKEACATTFPSGRAVIPARDTMASKDSLADLSIVFCFLMACGGHVHSTRGFLAVRQPQRYPGKARGDPNGHFSGVALEGWKLPASRTMTNADTRNFLLDPPIDPGCSRILRDHPSRPNIEEPAWSRELDGQAERLGAPCRRCLAAKCPMDSEAQAPWALKRSLLTASEYSQAFISGVSL